MSPYLRLRPGRRENLLAAGVALGTAAGVAAVVFYFGRILISREKVSRLGETESLETSGRALEPASRQADRR